MMNELGCAVNRDVRGGAIFSGIGAVARCANMMRSIVVNKKVGGTEIVLNVSNGCRHGILQSV